MSTGSEISKTFASKGTIKWKIAVLESCLSHREVTIH